MNREVGTGGLRNLSRLLALAGLLSQFVDAVVLVARYGQTSKQSLLRARDLLVRANAKIAGVVMNKVDISSPDHYQSYGFYGSDSSEDFHYAS